MRRGDKRHIQQGKDLLAYSYEKNNKKEIIAFRVIMNMQFIYGVIIFEKNINNGKRILRISQRK